MSDYLWDGAGAPDPEVERLERALRPLRYAGAPPPLARRARRRRPAPWGSGLAAWAAAAGVAVAVGGGFWAWPREGWEVARISGAPRVAGSVVADRGRLAVGEWLETDGSARARLRIGKIGLAFVDPGSRIGLVDAGRRQHRLAMPLGVLHAEIWAPPGKFFVETPSALAVDLGCAYTLQVFEDGSGLLSVESGWVGFEHGSRESFVPKGAQCRTRPGVGPGTPFYADAPEAFKRSLEELDFGPGDPPLRDAALALLLTEAAPRDALTLWHLLLRGDLAERGRVYDRLAVLVPPPPGVSREGILEGDRDMRDAWWDELDLGSAGFWRLWKQPLPPQAR